MDDEQRDILAVLLDFAEENWGAFTARYNEKGNEEIDEETFNSLRDL
jgi:hypothetical protein